MLLAFLVTLASWYPTTAVLAAVDWNIPIWARVLPNLFYFGLLGLLIGRGRRIVRQAWIAFSGMEFSSACVLSVSLIALAASVDILSALIALGMFGVYTVARTGIIRVSGWHIPVTLLILGLLIPIASASGGWIKTGGLFNYDLGTGVIILLAVMWRSKYQWIAVAFAAASLFFSGAEEALIGIGALVAVAALKRDWKMALAPLAVAAVLVAALTPFGITDRLWHILPQRVTAAVQVATTQQIPEQPAYVPSVNEPSPEGVPRVDGKNGDISTGDEIDTALGYRWPIYVRAVKQATWFGHGFRGSYVVPHNAALAILESAGLLAMLLWLFLVGRALVISRLSYTIVAVLALSLFDHYIWYQLWPLAWIILGQIERDYARRTAFNNCTNKVLTTQNKCDTVQLWLAGGLPYLRYWVPY